MLIKDFGEYAFHRFENNMALQICEFAVRVNYEVHRQKVNNETAAWEIQKIHNEELSLFDELHYYVVTNPKGEMVGSIRAGLWNRSGKLPIHKDFDISPAYINHPGNIWHIGRFAVDPGKMDESLRKHRLVIFKTLLFHAIQHVCTQEDNIMLAECDRKLHEKVKLLNICSTKIGESKQYIGSETVPIFNTSNNLKSFLWNHKHLQYSCAIGYTLPMSSKKESAGQKYCSPEQEWAA